MMSVKHELCMMTVMCGPGMVHQEMMTVSDDSDGA